MACKGLILYYVEPFIEIDPQVWANWDLKFFKNSMYLNNNN
jgi:hypothetical protein